MREKPIEECYWVVPGRFLAGEYPGSTDQAAARAKVSAFVRVGVTTFVDLTEEGELDPYAPFLHPGVSHHRFPIRDYSVPHSRLQVTEALDLVDRRLEEGGIVYLHCWGGIGRTGLMVGCWLARHGHKGKAALQRLRELWRQCPKSAWQRSPEAPQQEAYILAWEEAER